MTTKSKTRKDPAAKAMPKAAAKPNGAGEAEKLIARWDFLTAEGAYKASIAATEEEADTCFRMHASELDQIADKLKELIPGSFYDALKLLWFVNSQTKDLEVRSDNLELKIIRNVTQALPDLKLDEINKARKESRKGRRMIGTSAVAKAISRVKKAQAAFDAAEAAHDDTADHFEAETDTCEELVKTPCASDEEFLEKLKYLTALEVNLFGNPFNACPEFVSVARAAALHFGEA